MNTVIKRSALFIRRFLKPELCITVFSVLVLLFVVRNIGTWLTVSDIPPEHIDVICTFAGDSRRVEYSKKLMAENPETSWFLSDYRDGYARLLQKSDFDMSRVVVVDTCKSTISEVNAFSTLLNDYCRRGTRCDDTINVVLVSSPYHMRRIKIMAGRRIKTGNVTLYLIPVPLEKYKWDRNTFRYWWRSGKIASLILEELFKTAYFIMTGYF